MRIDWWTLGLQAINFLVLVVLLRRFLYQPVARAIARRKEQTEKAIADAAAATTRADEERKQLATERAAWPAERERLLAEVRAEVAAERLRAVDATRAEVEAIRVAARDKLADEHAAATADLRHHAVELALELAASILRASASTAVAEALVGGLADRLGALPAEELGRLRVQVSNGHTLEIVTAPALGVDAEARLRARMAERLGPDAHVAFAFDDQLIAGAELRFPSTVITLSWRDALDRARKELEHDVTA